MASSTFGPTSRAALPCQTASSTSLGSNRVRRTEGSSAPTATRSWRTLRLAGARLPAQEQVALGQGDRDLGAVLVLTDRDGLPQRQRARVRPAARAIGVGSASGSRRSTTTRAWRALAGSRTTRTSRTDEEGGDALGLGLQIGHLAAGRHPDPELLPSPGQPTAHDPGHPVVDGGQLGMATGQRPPPPQMRPEQGVGERLPGPGDHRHHDRGGHDQPLRTLPGRAGRPATGRRPPPGRSGPAPAGRPRPAAGGR